jgi:hypothetical protein
LIRKVMGTQEPPARLFTTKRGGICVTIRIETGWPVMVTT